MLIKDLLMVKEEKVVRNKSKKEVVGKNHKRGNFTFIRPKKEVNKED